jgi:hypothetical protein
LKGALALSVMEDTPGVNTCAKTPPTTLPAEEEELCGLKFGYCYAFYQRHTFGGKSNRYIKASKDKGNDQWDFTMNIETKTDTLET